MNPHFSFNRWWLLVQQHWAENRKRYFLSIAAFAGLLVMWYFLLLVTVEENPLNAETRKGTFFFLLFFSAAFYANQFFRDLGNRIKAANYLLLPASAAEKFFTGLFYVLIGFSVVYLGIFYIVDVVMVLLGNAIHPYYNTPGQEHNVEMINVFGKLGNDDATPYLYAVYLAIQAAFLLGSVYFERYSFVKTVISLFVFFLLIYLVESVFTNGFLPNDSYHNTLTSYRIQKAPGQVFLVQLPQALDAILRTLLLVVFPPFFWIITYLRLKEKEV